MLAVNDSEVGFKLTLLECVLFFAKYFKVLTQYMCNNPLLSLRSQVTFTVVNFNNNLDC